MIAGTRTLETLPTHQHIDNKRKTKEIKTIEENYVNFIENFKFTIVYALSRLEFYFACPTKWFSTQTHTYTHTTKLPAIFLIRAHEQHLGCCGCGWQLSRTKKNAFDQRNVTKIETNQKKLNWNCSKKLVAKQKNKIRKLIEMRMFCNRV